MQEITLAFEAFGELKNPPIIILHGFFASSRNWRSCAEKLAVHFCVYVLDARNHGASPHCNEMNYDTMVTDVLHFIRQHQLQNVTLIGHSMGGKTAMWFALNYPQHLKNLVVVDIAPIGYTHTFDPIINALKNLPITQLSNRKQADEWLATVISEQSYRQFLLQNLILKKDGYQWRIDLDIFQKNADAIIAFPESDQCLPFEKPTLFLAGQNSKYIPVGSSALLFPHAILNVIPDAEHWIHVQQPEAFLSALTNFLQ